MILTPASTIDVDDLPENLRLPKPMAAVADERCLPLEEVERRHIVSVLETTRGNVTAAARRLGVNRGTLYRKIQNSGDR